MVKKSVTKFAVLIVICCFSVSNSNAAPWHIVSVLDEQILLIDSGSIRENGQHFDVWFMSFYFDLDDRGLDHSIFMERVSCLDRKSAIVAGVGYGKDNKSIFSLNLEANEIKWKYVIPGSVGEAQLDTVCGKRKLDLPIEDPVSTFREFFRRSAEEYLQQ